MNTQNISPKFPLGQVVSTPTVLDIFNPLEICFMLARHHSGDWGDCGKEDAKANEEALKENNRIISVYKFDNKRICWIITEWDRSVTTLLLPSEY